MEVNAYKSNYQVSNSNSENYLKVQEENEALDMQDFLDLLVAQMTNQDAMNPMDNTEFMAQMAQFSSLQAMSDLSEMSMQGQVTSLIGKNVIVARYNNQGELEIQEGIVQKVTFFSGEARLYVNDEEFGYSNIMEIIQDEQQEVDPVQETLNSILESINSLNESLSKEELPEDIIDPQAGGEK